VSQDALKPTIYPGERDRAGGRFPADALVDVFAAHARLGGTGSSRSSAPGRSRARLRPAPRRRS
jgi:hypothetical protein